MMSTAVSGKGDEMKQAGANSSKMQWRSVKGFTLIEIMIVVVIVAILMAIAIPSYREFVRRGNRAEARQKLQQAALWLQQAATNDQAGLYPVQAAFTTANFALSNNSYTITYQPGNPRTTYVLTATRGTIQAGDECGNYTLTQANVRDIVNPPGTKTQALVDRCWGG